MTQAKKNSSEEIAAPPMVDDRGFPLIVIGRLFPCMSNSDIAARAKVYGAWRAMTERDYMAGAGLTVRDRAARVTAAGASSQNGSALMA